MDEPFDLKRQHFLPLSVRSTTFGFIARMDFPCRPRTGSLHFLTLATLLAGCATSKLVVSINPTQVATGVKAAPRSTQVQLTDIRRESSPERTTVGGI
jgi:hypothetical protein